MYTCEFTCERVCVFVGWVNEDVRASLRIELQILRNKIECMVVSKRCSPRCKLRIRDVKI